MAHPVATLLAEREGREAENARSLTARQSGRILMEHTANPARSSASFTASRLATPLSAVAEPAVNFARR